MGFVKAEKSKSLLRAALMGVSGSGKTMTALRIAQGMLEEMHTLGSNGRIGVIDSERGSAAKYSDRYDFDIYELDKLDIDAYIQAVNEAEHLGLNPLIIDSTSHAWDELLAMVDQLSATSAFKGNKWAAWSKGTPKQKKFIRALLGYPGHLIVTMRSKTTWATDEKRRPVRIGTSPEQGKNIEYEFDLLVEISQEHVATVLKDRTGRFQDRIMEKPGEEFGRELVRWLNEGRDIPVPAPREAIKELADMADEYGVLRHNLKGYIESIIGPIESSADMTMAQVEQVTAELKKMGKPERTAPDTDDKLETEAATIFG